MKPFDFDTAAEEELVSATTYYETRRPGLGAEFREAFEEALQKLRENPEGFARVGVRARRCPLHRFPYQIVYFDLDDRIWIAAVTHHSRKPGSWSRRRPD